MTTRTAQGALTLPREYYTSQEIFDRESQKIFGEQWICVGRTSEIAQPGSYFLYELDDGIHQESIIITRDQQGEAHAYYNVCRHRGTRICTAHQGQFSETIQCPYHAWTYSLNGELLGAPNMKDMADFRREDYPLHEAALTEWEGFLMLNLSPTPTPFEEVYAPIIGRFENWQLDRLQSARCMTYDVQANWKLIFQNYNECYHCPTVHPLLNRLTPYKNAVNDLEDGPFLGGPMSMDQPGSMTMSGQRCAPPLGNVAGDDLSAVYYYTMMPNFFLSLHPDYVLVHRLERRSVNETHVICDWLFDPEAIKQPGFTPDDAVEFWDMTNRQDWHVSELSQLGISSRAYTPGPYAELESVLAAFDREYLRLLQE